jgi:hypothetical protein
MLIAKFAIANGRLTYNESGESGMQMLKYIHEQEQNDLDDAGDCLYEDQKRSQPRNLSDFDDSQTAIRPDIVVKVRRSNSHPYFGKYSGSKGKHEIVSPAYDKGKSASHPTSPRSKILLGSTNHSEQSVDIEENG